MRVSVVINTYNRADSLARTLDALRYQTHDDFEVIVVNGPSDDGTEALLDRWNGVRRARCAEVNLSKSRNIGIEHAAGDVVAFIDDDGIPEPRWIEELVAGYAGGDVAGVGGLVRDPTGVLWQYRFSLCSRLGETQFPANHPGPEATEPGADPFLYLQGVNASFRREALVAIGGFDEEINYMHDETELCVTLIDAGYRLRALDGAIVHHKYLPSHLRNSKAFTDPFHSVKNRAYFALRVGADSMPVDDIVAAHREELQRDIDSARVAHANNHLTASELATFVQRAEDGLELGLARGIEGRRRGRSLADPGADAFAPYPVLRPPRPGRIVLTSGDYPPRPTAGVSRYTVDLAEAMASRGHEVHVVTRDDEGDPLTVDFERGVWVHRYRDADRHLPELDGSALRPSLERAATIHAVVDRIRRERGVDVVCGPLWGAETLMCGLDPELRVVTVAMTPMRTVAELQPKLTQQGVAQSMITLEDAALRCSDHLIPISEANARVIEAVDGVSERPSTVVHLGVTDRRSRVSRRRALDDDAVRILFVGRLEARKGVDVLLRAAAQVLREAPAAELVLVGSDNANWSAGEDWRELARELANGDHALLDRIRFAGQVDDDELLRELADADVLCAPSRYESFGLVVAEAMMMGRAVVATDAGGIPEFARDDETALLVAPGAVGPLRDALARVVEDRALRERLGEAGRRRYEESLDIDVVVDRMLEVLLPPANEQPAAAPASDALAASVRIIAEITGLRDVTARDVAATLLDPSRFPVDLSLALSDLHDPGPETLALAVQRAVRGRDPIAEESERAWQAIGPEMSLRDAAAWAISDAGTETYVRPEATEVLPRRSAAALIRDLRLIWLIADDAEFVAALVALLDPEETSEAQTAARAALADDGRRAALRALGLMPHVQRQVGTGPLLDTLDLRTTQEIADELSKLASASTEDAVEGAFRLLVGRAPSPDDRVATLHELTVVTRGELIDGLADTPSAIGYGSEPDVIHRLVAEEPGLHRKPRLTRLRKRPIVRRVEMLMRDLLRDAADSGAIARQLPLSVARVGEGVDALRAGIDGRIGELARGLEDQRARDTKLVREVAELQRRIDVLQKPADEGVRAVVERVARIEDGVKRVDERIGVLSTKYQAMALDLRERLPVEVQEELPEPVVLDQRALEPGVKTNLGCGEKPLDGYVNVDFRELPGVTVVADVRRLPFAPRSLSEIASHHLIEHFRENHLRQVVLPHWLELLADDGILRVVTPNLEVLARWHQSGRISGEEFKQVLYGLQDYAGDDHFALYTPASLTRLLTDTGFRGIEVLETDRPNGLSPELEVTARPRR